MNATVESINESIRVVAGFNRDGKLTPLVFEWRNRRYERFEIIKTWRVPEGIARKVCFTLTPDKVSLYEIYFQTRDFQWILAKIYHE